MIYNYLESLSRIEIIFLIIGFIGQGLFASRFIVQWIYSEKKRGEFYTFSILVFKYIWWHRVINLRNF